MKNPFTYRKRRKAAEAKRKEDFIKRGRAAVAKEYQGLFYDASGKCFGAMTRKGIERQSYHGELHFWDGKLLIKDAIKRGFIPLDAGGCLVFGYVVKYTIKETSTS